VGEGAKRVMTVSLMGLDKAFSDLRGDAAVM
jgi:hypothetical protein